MEENCEYMAGCLMYEQFRLDRAREVFISLYCRGDFEKCVRKLLRDKGMKVPEKLLPNGKRLP